MRCALSTVTTRRSWLISFTVRVLGTSTSMPDCRIGAVIIKMTSSTRTTSMKGTMLISDSEICVCLESCGIVSRTYWRPGWDGRACSAKSFFNLRDDFHGKCVQPLRQVPNILQKLVIENQRRNRGEKSRGCGDQRFGDAGSDRAQTRGAGAAQAGKRIDDPPNGPKEPDKRRNRSGGSQPGHSFFHAAHFFGGSKLHAYRNGLQALDPWRMRISGATA